VGRQPWIVYGVMRTSNAVTPLNGIVVPLLVFTALYFFLAWVVLQLMRRMVFATVPAEPGRGA
jgi:cytochrome d ubiquinol oxidase subunit I